MVARYQAVVGDVNPERTLVRLAGAGCQDRKPGVVGVDLGAGTADLTDAIVDRIEQSGGIAGAASKGGSLDIDALGWPSRSFINMLTARRSIVWRKPSSAPGFLSATALWATG